MVVFTYLGLAVAPATWYNRNNENQIDIKRYNYLDKNFEGTVITIFIPFEIRKEEIVCNEQWEGNLLDILEV